MTTFRDLHVPGKPLVMPNPWDAGSAAMMEAMGFKALASSSAGAAFSVGLVDGSLNLDGLLDAALILRDATELPVNADLENGGGDSADDAAAAVTRARASGLEGASIEDFSGSSDAPIYPFEQALERVEAAVEAAQGSLVLTARAEGMLQQNGDFADVLRRITAFAQAGADVVYAPGLRDADQISAVVKAASDTPVNVLLGSNALGLSVDELANLGVARISLGSGPARAAYGAMLTLCRDLMENGNAPYPADTASFKKIETLLHT